MENIDKILEKYFEGETSLQEEETLRKYFTSGNIAEKHKVYGPLFGYFELERNKQNDVTTKPKRRISWPYAWSGIAASIIIILFFKIAVFPTQDDFSRSLVYIDGKKVSDIETINSQALKSIENISDIDEDAINMQISVLESFTD